MRADRLISILLLLQNRGKVTTKELAEELEVSGRTIHRDMEALSAAGIPIVADRGQTGGWRLLERYRTTLTGLKEKEIESLLLSPPEQLLEDLGLTEEWRKARQKLLASIPGTIQKDVSDVWNRIYIDTKGWRQPVAVLKSFHVLQEAIWAEQKLSIKYERADGKNVERLVHPLGLVAKGSIWYLVAACNGEIRNYRASRISSAVMVNESFSRPPDFNLGVCWRNSIEDFISNLPKYEVEVYLAPAVVQRLRFTGKFVQTLQLSELPDKDWVWARLLFDTEQEAVECLLGFGDNVRVDTPEKLKRKIYEAAKAVVEAYEAKKD